MRRLKRHLPEFERTYDERYAKHYGPWRPIIGEVVRRLLRCWRFALRLRPVRPLPRLRRTKCSSPSLPPAVRCAPVAIRSGHCWPPRPSPKRSVPRSLTARSSSPFPNACGLTAATSARLLGELACAAWLTVAEVYRQVLDRDDVTPGMVAGIQTFGELIHFHPHIHAIASDGAFTADGTFLCLPKIDAQRLLTAWQTKVFELIRRRGQDRPGDG